MIDFGSQLVFNILCDFQVDLQVYYPRPPSIHVTRCNMIFITHENRCVVVSLLYKLSIAKVYTVHHI